MFAKRGPSDPRSSGPVIEAGAHFLAGLEEGNVLLGDLHALASTRITALPRFAALHRERPEAAQFDAVAARQGVGNFIENRSDDALDVALIEVWVALSQMLYQLGFCHGSAHSRLDREEACQTNDLASRLASNGRPAYRR